MHRWRLTAAACVAALTFGAGGLPSGLGVAYSAPAQATPTQARRAQAVQDKSAQPRLLLFAGADLWRHGAFGHGGALYAPRGLERDGAVAKLLFYGGTYRYRSGALGGAEVQGSLRAASILPGYRFVRGPLTVTLLAGLDVQDHRLSPDDAAAGLRGTHVGLRGGLELWYQPVPGFAASFDISGTTIGPGYAARLAMGWAMPGGFLIGPEIAALDHDGRYRQFRAGVHFTALRIGGVELTAAGGWATDTDRRAGGYGRIGMIARR